MTKFVDLPHAKSGSKPDPTLVAYASDLRSRPGQWAEYPRPMKSAASAAYIKAGRGAFEGGGFEARYIQGAVYARFVGAA